MSSPFSRYMEGKNPVSNLKSEAAKRSGISDKEHHAISSGITGKQVLKDPVMYAAGPVTLRCCEHKTK